ncbi:MEDS domain-containing protein [Lentzea sp. NPDC102401]|uniref:MEDS domain-containing protein n=1 Tax=Lentzea sp. NPDC102401 TaxID=3364128 RepID=UPI0037F6003F
MTNAVFDGATLRMHSHLCVFHHGGAERDDLLIPFLSDGLRSGEACQYFAVAGEKDDAEQRLGGPHPRLRVQEPGSRYQCDDVLDSDAILAELDEWSQGEGTSCRIAGDMGWAGGSLRSQDQLDALFRHEINAGLWVNRRPVYALCFYDLDLFDGDVIIPMVKAHPQIWMTGVLVDNPYHEQSAI